VATGHEEKHSVGEMPDPTLSLWNSGLIALILVAFALAARRQFAKVPHGIQNLAEYIVEQLYGFTVGIIGPHGAKYTPIAGTVFLYVLLMNLIGLIPILHSPSANLSITLALGVVVFVYVQIEGLKSNGPARYVQHFAGDMPWQGILIPIKALLLFPVEIISECARPFTLAIRLFGNIFGEDVIILVLAGLGGTFGGALLGWIPIQAPLLLLGLLTSFVQAMVFTILTCVYLSLVTHPEHESGHGEEEPQPATHSHATGH
jgi:F-type H+-transporting ATPase subunit a